jgi:SAM-dependent methyltransferase
MNPMPLAGMFCATKEEAVHAPAFPLTWLQCVRCGLVQVREDIPDSFLFSSYNYSSSTVGGLVRHFEGYAKLLGERYGTDSKIRFLEIGCNDGVLLKRLPSKWTRIGCDPSDVAARGAIGSDYELFSKPFSIDMVKQAGLENTIDVISGSNCLAHISDLKAVFEAVHLALRPGGHFWIEVHDLDELLEGGQWDTIYHEHKAEWSENSLVNCLEAVGFVHKETDRIPMHGGALRTLVEKGTAKRSPNREGTANSNLAVLNRSYKARYETAAAKSLLNAQGAGRPIGAYGAAGRANVYLNQLPDLKFEYIVDESPLRANKYIPRVATPIVSPVSLEQNPVESCLITAWNYRDDIIRKNPQHRGEWLTAFGET